MQSTPEGHGIIEQQQQRRRRVSVLRLTWRKGIASVRDIKDPALLKLAVLRFNKKSDDVSFILFAIKRLAAGVRNARMGTAAGLTCDLKLGSQINHYAGGRRK